VGQEKTVNGVYIKVFDAYPVHSYLKDNDACKVFIGGTIARYAETRAETAEKDKSIEAGIQEEIPADEAGGQGADAAPQADAYPEITNASAQAPEEFKPIFVALWERIAGFFKRLFS